MGETVDVKLTWELPGTPVQPFNKVWLEFERYDPALYYPLGRGTDKDRTLRFLSENFDPSDPKDVYRMDASTYQPVATVPHEEVVVEGNLVRQGAPLKPHEKVQLEGKVRFPEEGEWAVYCRFQSEGRFPWSQSEVQLTVGEESGAFGWPEAYSKGSGSGWSGPKEDSPIAVTLKPGRAPLLGGPLDLTVVIQSARDVPEGEAYLHFFRQEGDVSNKNADYRVEGDLSWSGSLQKDVLVELSGKVTFNEEGDWRIQALSRTPEIEGGVNKHNIYLHVGKEASRYGWTGSEGPRSPPVEGTPTPAPVPEPRPPPRAGPA